MEENDTAICNEVKNIKLIQQTKHFNALKSYLFNAKTSNRKKILRTLKCHFSTHGLSCNLEAVSYTHLDVYKRQMCT